MSEYWPQIPTSSFDPALYLHSEDELLAHSPSHSHSDELEALQQCAAADRAEKIKKGIVIHHRAWRTAEAFRSEEDYPIDTPLKHLGHLPTKRFPAGLSTDGSFPSSPPSVSMPLASSPITYPSSSVPKPQSPKKRKRSDQERSPLQDVQANRPGKTIGGFLDDSDDEDQISSLKEHAPKRRVVSSIKDVGAAPDMDTPPASQEAILDPETVTMDELDDYLKTPSPKKQPVLAETPALEVRKSFGTTATTAAGTAFYIQKRISRPSMSYEQLIASRSGAEKSGAQKSYYGVDIHSLLDQAKQMDEEKLAHQQQAIQNSLQSSVEPTVPRGKPSRNNRVLMWTEKYRAKKFTDLVGDERTHRSVLRWLKGWDPIVFPGSGKVKTQGAMKQNDNEEQRHRKVLLLTGPPGLGKTTLAHVCARQAGYEVQEINASDERSGAVVKGRIRDIVGTENVRGLNTTTAKGKIRKAGKPICVVVDEVDGVTSGSGGTGEGGFIKALIDLINLDEKNSRSTGQQASTSMKKRKGDKFRLLRPLILVCNDVYHPSLRPLRQSSHAEIIHIRKPALNMVVSRIHDIFLKEGITADSDGVRRLCEATWGVSTKKEGGTGNGAGEGDIRGVMVVSEWVAGRLRAAQSTSAEPMRLSRRWVEDNVINDLRHGGGATRSLGRGGGKDVVDRVFREGAGFPKQAETTVAKEEKKGTIGVAEAAKQRAMDRLHEMVNTSGEIDRIVSDCFTVYPDKPFQDDTLLSKPTAAYEWLHFHDTLSSQVHGSQEWELMPYLSQSVLAFHDLFASPRQHSSNLVTDPDAQPTPFTGPGASYAAAEASKANRAQLMALQSTLSLPLTRMFKSPAELATELLPYTLRMLSPDVKPVIVNTGPSGSKSSATASVRKASEKALVRKAVDAMAATGVRFQKSRVEFEDAANRNGGWVLRMEPPLDALGAFETLDGKKDEKVRYAVRSVLESEWKRESLRLDTEARKRRGGQLEEDITEHEDPKAAGVDATALVKDKVKKDFFGRAIKEREHGDAETEMEMKRRRDAEKQSDEGRIWVSFHEGFSNAVRKPITLDELMRGL